MSANIISQNETKFWKLIKDFKEYFYLLKIKEMLTNNIHTHK